ncbi:MAG TPA: general stress protein [Actinomycetes bacterium]|nr:general stress protein [Actinomycetes bacterium]
MTDTESIVVRECSTYEEAQRAVDFLSDRELEVSGIQIVGRDVQLIETVTGRMSYGRAAGGGMVTGAWFGLLIGMLLGLFANPDQDPSWATLLLLGVLWGAMFGIVYGLIAHAASRGRRDFSSRSKLEAARYDVVCPATVAGRARQLLAEMPAST